MVLFHVFRFHSVYEPVPEWLSHRYRNLLVQCYNVKWPTMRVSLLYISLSHTIFALNRFVQQHLIYIVQIKA